MNSRLIVPEYQETQRSSMKRNTNRKRFCSAAKFMNLVKEIPFNSESILVYGSGWWHMVMDHGSESSIIWCLKTVSMVASPPRSSQLLKCCNATNFDAFSLYNTCWQTSNKKWLITADCFWWFFNHTVVQINWSYPKLKSEKCPNFWPRINFDHVIEYEQNPYFWPRVDFEHAVLIFLL